jgi:hypothetical protein
MFPCQSTFLQQEFMYSNPVHLSLASLLAVALHEILSQLLKIIDVLFLEQVFARGMVDLKKIFVIIFKAIKRLLL